MSSAARNQCYSIALMDKPLLSDSCQITCVHLIKHAAFHLTSAVMRAKLEILALVLGTIGLVGTIAVTAMPMWKVTAYIGPHRDGDAVGGVMDGLHTAGGHQHAVQSLRLSAHPAGGHPGGPRAHVCLHHFHRPGRPGVRLRDEGHRLLP